MDKKRIDDPVEKENGQKTNTSHKTIFKWATDIVKNVQPHQSSIKLYKFIYMRMAKMKITGNSKF